MGKLDVLVTGSSGYLGTVLCRELSRAGWCGPIWGTDIQLPMAKFDNFGFRRFDVGDPGLADWMCEVRPDAVVHLAFVVDPIHDEERMHRINVGGTRNVLQAAAKAEVGRVVVASSGSAYGAWPDNPVPLTEDDPLRPPAGFAYAVHKKEVEEVCERFVKEHPEVVFSIIRPGVVYGPGVNNYISRILTGMPVVVLPKSDNPPLQFVHEDDVAGAVMAILEKEVAGVFNVAPPETMTVEEAGEIATKPKVFLPAWLLEPVVDWAWKLKIPLLNAPAAMLNYMIYPWVLDSSRLTRETGYRFRYSSMETLQIMLRAKGVR